MPDPRGVVGFALVLGVLFFHLALPFGQRSYLWSENAFLEVLAHLWLILAPPLGVYLGLRNLLVAGDSLLPLVSVPLGAFLSLMTGLSIVVSLFLA